MKTEMPRGEHPAEASAKKSWMKPVAAVVEARRAETAPGSGADGVSNCHS